MATARLVSSRKTGILDASNMRTRPAISSSYATLTGQDRKFAELAQALVAERGARFRRRRGRPRRARTRARTSLRAWPESPGRCADNRASSCPRGRATDRPGPRGPGHPYRCDRSHQTTRVWMSVLSHWKAWAAEYSWNGAPGETRRLDQPPLQPNPHPQNPNAIVLG